MKLLLSKKLLTKVIYDLILIIVDQLIKKTRFILYLKASNIKELVYMFLRNITVFNRLLEEIISNRNKLFIFNF